MWTSKNRAHYDRSKLRYPSDLTDDEWGLVEPLIPPGKTGGGKRRVNERSTRAPRSLAGVRDSHREGVTVACADQRRSPSASEDTASGKTAASGSRSRCRGAPTNAIQPTC